MLPRVAQPAVLLGLLATAPATAEEADCRLEARDFAAAYGERLAEAERRLLRCLLERRSVRLDARLKAIGYLVTPANVTPIAVGREDWLAATIAMLREGAPPEKDGTTDKDRDRGVVNPVNPGHLPGDEGNGLELWSGEPKIYPGGVFDRRPCGFDSIPCPEPPTGDLCMTLCGGLSPAHPGNGRVGVVQPFRQQPLVLPLDGEELEPSDYEFLEKNYPDFRWFLEPRDYQYFLHFNQSFGSDAQDGLGNGLQRR